MAYTIPNGYDLIAWREGDEHKIMAVCADWHGTPVPFINAASLICPELAAQRPKDFATVKDAEAWFMITHFFNMHQKENAAGQDYPVALEVPKL